MWIVLPSTCCPSALVSEDLRLVSDELFQVLALSAGLNGMSTGLRSWRNAWKKKPWMQRLCGQICTPLMAFRGVGSWIALLQATRASHSPSPGSAVERSTPNISGLSAPESSESLKPSGYSLKTSPGTSPSDSILSGKSYKKWVIELRQDSTRRLRQAELTRGFACTLSGENLWATPTRRDWKDGISPSSKVPTKGLLGRQAPRSQHVGGMPSSEIGEQLQLSPWFEEVLMGFPIGWTELRP